MNRNEKIAKLKELNVYDEFMANVSDSESVRIGHNFVQEMTFHDFISVAFTWEDAPEGHDHWQNISKL